MYRYGDGTPFPLEENFIETLTAAVEACTNAFMPLTELDGRRERSRAGRVEADRELGRLADLEKTLNGALAPYMVPDRKGAQTQTVAQKIVNTAKDAIRLARTQVEGRVQALEAEADQVLAAALGKAGRDTMDQTVMVAMFLGLDQARRAIHEQRLILEAQQISLSHAAE